MMSQGKPIHFDAADVHVQTCASLPPGTILMVTPGAYRKTQAIDADGRIVYEREEIDWSKVAAVVKVGTHEST